MTLKLGSELESCPPYIDRVGDDIIMDILVRLPTKACLKCKLVCKRWYAMISSPEFAGQRRRFGSYISLLFMGRLGPELMLLDIDKWSKQHLDQRFNLIISDDEKIVFKPKLRYRNDKLIPVNECNGLLCFKTEGWWSSFMICNLLTGQQVTVKQPACRVGYTTVSCGWGYSPTSQQYKILRILRPRSRSRPRAKNNCLCVAEIYTLGADHHEWRCVDNNAPGELSFHVNAFLNGSIHGCCRSSNSIWCFNFDTEQFSLVPLSHEVMSAGDIMAVSTFESFLCCTTSKLHSPGITFLNDAVSEVWIMKEYGNKDSWVNLYVSLPDHSSLPLLQPINNNTGGYMLVSFVGRKLNYCFYNNSVFGAYSFASRSHHVLQILRMPLCVMACNTMFSQLPMKQLY